MNHMFSHLSRLCTEHRFERKLLVVPSHTAGHQMIEAIVLAGTSVVNVHPVTTRDLALEAAAERISADKLKLLSAEAELSIVEDVFRREILGRQDSYFGGLEPLPGILSALAHAVREMRLSGLSSKTVQQEHFVSPQKHQDIQTILREFENYLGAERALDNAGLFKLALESRARTRYAHSLFLLVPGITLSPLELELVRALSNGTHQTLEQDQVDGLVAPRHVQSASPSSQPSGILSSILKGWEGPDQNADPRIQIFHAIGSHNEIKEILRRVRKGGVAFDRVEIACLDYGTYSRLIFEEQQKRGIPVTYSDGVPVMQTGPGVALMGFIDWIEDGYLVSDLRRLLAANVLQRSQCDGLRAVSGSGTVRILRKARIGWGRDRYVERLTKYRDSRAFESPDDAESDESARKKTKEETDDIEWVITFVSGLLACAPVEERDGCIDPRAAIVGLRVFLEDYTKKPDELDRLSYGSLVAALNDLSGTGRKQMTLQDFCSMMRTRVTNLHVGFSGAKPGHMHVTSISKAGYSAREWTFVPGLTEDTFPGVVTEDPILLDNERRKISPDLPTAGEIAGGRRFRLYTFLASLRGTLTISYPSYDIVEGRQRFPSPLVLQTLRLQRRDNTLDYTGLRQVLGPPVGFVTCDEIDATDWWLKNIDLASPSENARRAVLETFQGLAAGTRALEARRSGSFTEFDGNVPLGPEDDPRVNGDLVVSSSSLEKFAGCPFQYYVENVLGLRKPEDIEFDPLVWLDAASRGILLHSIYEEFMKTLSERKETVDVARHKELLTRIADTRIAAMKDEIPPPCEEIYQQERRDLIEGLEIFLAMQAMCAVDGTPEYFELTFGKGDEQPVMMDLDGSRISLKGRIDRIDRLKDGEFRVLDYKTGSDYGYSRGVYFDGGQQLQHAIYSIAAEEILRRRGIVNARVKEAGYQFPTSRGKLQQILNPQHRRRDLIRVMTLLFDAMKEGAFLAPAEPCYLCRDYHLCSEEKEKSEAKERYGGKINNPNNAGLAPLRDLAKET